MNQQSQREEGGRKAYNAWREVCPSCWEWEKIDEVSREGWRHVWDVMQEDRIPTLPHPAYQPGVQMQ